MMDTEQDLVVRGGGEAVSLLGGDDGIAVDELGEHATLQSSNAIVTLPCTTKAYSQLICSVQTRT